MSLVNKIIIGALIMLLTIACIAAFVGWRREIPVLSRTEYLPAPEIKKAAKIPRMRVPVKEIVALDKKVAAKTMQIPEALVKDDHQQITATAAVPPYEGQTNTLVVMDTSTGESQIIARQEPLSFIAFETKKEIGVRYGITIKNGMEADVFGRWDFLRIGSIHLGVYGEVNSLGDGKAMLSLAYRW